MPTPLILCHYGNSYYLPYVFHCATITNPDREIILLDDDANEWLADQLVLKYNCFYEKNWCRE